MKGYTHLAFGIVAALLSSHFLNPVNRYLFIAIIIISSILPDIDTTKSLAGKPIWPLSLIIRWICNHRGFFHSLLIIIIVSFLFQLFLPAYLILAFVIGYCSHLLLDGLTPQGVPLLYPLEFRLRGFISTGSFLEKALFMLLIIMAVPLVYISFFI